MQTGKEPLRSFSDLLQFMKKEKEEPVVVRQDVEKVVPQKQEATESTPTSAEPSSESVVNRVDSTQSGDASDTSA